MLTLGVVLIVLIPLLGLACGRSGSNPPAIDATLASQLQKAADAWFGRGPGEVPETSWPAEVRALRPRSIRVTTEGTFIELNRRFIESEGLFILPLGSSFAPPTTDDPAFRLLRDRVYWFTIKG